MSLSVLLLVALAGFAAVGWYFFRGENEEEGESPAESASSFRCKVCGATSPTYVAAHEHASAEHDLAGHRLDDAIEAVAADQKAS